jgi:hypothetical protein
LPARQEDGVIAIRRAVLIPGWGGALLCELLDIFAPRGETETRNEPTPKVIPVQQLALLPFYCA